MSAPVLSKLSIKAAKVRGSKAKAKKKKRKVAGRVISFTLDRDASVTLSVSKVLAGRKKGKKCVATRRKGAKCTITRSIGNIAVAKGLKGLNSVKFSGKVAKRKLKRGSYRLTATPTGGTARVVKFKVR